MRISADPTDPGWDRYAETLRERQVVRIFCDGREIVNTGVITADEENGIVLALDLDANGNVRADPEEPTRPMTRVLRGRVTVRIGGEPPPLQPKSGVDWFAINKAFST